VSHIHAELDETTNLMARFALGVHTDFTVVDDIASISPIVVSIANRFAEYEASGSAAWDVTVDVTQRPQYLRKSQTKEFERKPQVQLPDDHAEDTTNDDDYDAPPAIGLLATVDTDITEVEEQQLQINQYELLKRRQQEQMQALLSHQAEVNRGIIVVEKNNGNEKKPSLHTKSNGS
jgi:hypothetical protein